MLHTLIKLAPSYFSVALAVFPSPSTIENAAEKLRSRPSLSEYGSLNKVNGINIWHAEFGKPNPQKLPVIFLHGGFLNSDYFGEVIRSLPQDRRIIAMDVRGHGRSERDESPLSYKLFAQDATALLTKLGITRAAFVGWGFMAVTTMEAMLHQDTKGFVGGAFLWGGYHDLAARNPKWNSKDNPFYNEVANNVRADFEKYQSIELLRRFSPILAKFDQQGPRYTAKDLEAIQLGNKVTVAFGAREEVVLEEEFKTLPNMIKGSNSVIVPGVSHFGPVQNPGALTPEINKFLERLDASAR